MLGSCRRCFARSTSNAHTTTLHLRLQAQLRAQLLSQLQSKGQIPASAAESAAAALIATGAQQDQQPRDQQRQGAKLWRAAMDALVADHLASCGLECSLSVFAAEAAMPDAGAPFGPDDLLTLLRIQERHPDMHHMLTRQLLASQKGARRALQQPRYTLVRSSDCG